MQPEAQCRAASLPSPPRKMSMTPPMTPAGFSRAAVSSPAAAVTGQASTHLPQRVQASIMVSTRLCRADLKVSGMADNIAPSAHSRDSGNPDGLPRCGRTGSPLRGDEQVLARDGKEQRFPGAAQHGAQRNDALHTRDRRSLRV